MNRDELIQLAREAGATPYTNRHLPDRPFHTFSPEQLEVFVELVVAVEHKHIAEYLGRNLMSAREYAENLRAGGNS